MGTIIGTLNPPVVNPAVIPTSAATHVSIIAITSTAARIIFGIFTDLLAPTSVGHNYRPASNSLASLPPRNERFTVSRVAFLLGSALLISLGQLILASGFIQDHAERFWIVSALIGSGWALFSLTPLIITVIWGVENFGTNWVSWPWYLHWELQSGALCTGALPIGGKNFALQSWHDRRGGRSVVLRAALLCNDILGYGC